MNTLNKDLRIPDNFQEYDGEGLMSNFDHEIVEETMNAIKGKKLYSRYAGWNFNGICWWQNEQWHCEVWCYRSYQQTFSADTLEEIKSDVCSEYGYD